MRRLLLVAAASLSLSSAAQAAQPVRLVEAYAAPDVSRGASLKIAPQNEAQAKDPAFAIMASRVGEALERAGFNLRQLDAETDVLVLLDYKAFGLALYQTGPFRVNDPSYYALAVAAVDAGAYKRSGELKLLWSTVVDSTGISANADRSIPRLIRGAERWFGRNSTGLRGERLAAGCLQTAGVDGDLSHPPPLTGSHISGVCRAGPNLGGLVAAGFTALGSPGVS